MHNGSMSKTMTIRDVPNEVRDELAARAARTGRSLQEYVRARLVDLASRPDAETLLADVRARKLTTGSRLPSAAILVHRDADRR